MRRSFNVRSITLYAQSHIVSQLLGLGRHGQKVPRFRPPLHMYLFLWNAGERYTSAAAVGTTCELSRTTTSIVSEAPRSPSQLLTQT
jgi:hypothetical protein